jgi:quinol monooxygenase YgiN
MNVCDWVDKFWKAYFFRCMAKFALYAHLKAKPEKRAEVEAFLKSALPLAQQEKQTITWYAFAEDEGSYGVFDTFDTEAGRQAHLDGPIAKALMSKASELLAEPPQIHKITLLADKH